MQAFLDRRTVAGAARPARAPVVQARWAERLRPLAIVIDDQARRDRIHLRVAGTEGSPEAGASSHLARDFSRVAVHTRDGQYSSDAPGVAEDADVRRRSEDGVRGSGRSLPHLDAIQRSFGRHDASSIVAHTDAAASQASRGIGAEAYATGRHVAFDAAPSLTTAAHEAAHVVQQRAGAQLSGGVGRVGDPYERHADAVAEAVAHGRSAERLLDAQGGGAAPTHPPGVQRKSVDTHYGTFKTTRFAKIARGVDIVLEFHPDPTKIDAKKIGLTQSVKLTYADGTHTGIDPTKEGRRVRSGSGADYVLDRISTRNNPIYGSDSLAAGDTTAKTKADNNSSGGTTTVGTNATYQLGSAYTDAGTKKVKEAALSDRPTAGDGNVFETTALGLEGTDQGKYFGSVKWGYEIKAGAVAEKDIELGSKGVPTQAYLAAADLWNATNTRGTMEVTAKPAKAKNASDLSDVDVAQGTKGTQVGEAVSLAGSKMMVKFQTVVGAKTYYILVTDLRDIQDGGATAKVPVPAVHVNPAATGWFSDEKMTKKVKDLPVGTRMKHTLSGIVKSSMRVIPFVGAMYGAGGTEMEIVDGPDTGKQGFVDAKQIKQET